jgi:simple sugar transport system substrate-binding protein
VNPQVGNVGLDARCRGLARAMKRVHGTSTVLAVNDQSPATPKRIATAAIGGQIDGVLTLNSTTGTEAVKAVRSINREGLVKIGTFDLGPDVLQAVKTGTIAFAVDQQAYLQGYLPVVYLAQRARYGLFPSQGDVVATGPNFVTKENAGKAIELSRRSIR